MISKLDIATFFLHTYIDMCSYSSSVLEQLVYKKEKGNTESFGLID